MSLNSSCSLLLLQGSLPKKHKNKKKTQHSCPFEMICHMVMGDITMLTSLDSISKLLPLEQFSAGWGERLLLQTEVRPGGCGSVASISFLRGGGDEGWGRGLPAGNVPPILRAAVVVSHPPRPAKTVCIRLYSSNPSQFELTDNFSLERSAPEEN